MKGCLNRWTSHLPSKHSASLLLKTPAIVLQFAPSIVAFRAAEPCRAWQEGHVARILVPVLDGSSPPGTGRHMPSIETCPPFTAIAMVPSGKSTSMNRPPGHGDVARAAPPSSQRPSRSEEHTSELQSQSNLV